MNGLRKKACVTGLVLVVLAALLAACSGGKNGGNGNDASGNTTGNVETAANEAAANEPAGGEGALPEKYDPPITITTVKGYSVDVNFKQGEDWDNNVFSRWLKDNLGIELKHEWTVKNANSSYQTKLKLMLTSGEKLPDVFGGHFTEADIEQIVGSGQVMDITDLYDKYASDFVKENMPAEAWYPVSKEGRKLGFPLLENTYASDNVMYIREDWLQKLGLKAPTTIDEMTSVMDAFVNKDPDGNGKKDTFGLAMQGKKIWESWMDANPIFGAYGAEPYWYVKDGQLVNGLTQPGMKDAVGKLAEWYKSGFLSPDFGTVDAAKATELFTSGKAGILFGPNWMPFWPLEDVKKNVPGANYKAYQLPAGPEGIGRSASPAGAEIYFLSKDMEHPEAFFTYMNKMYELLVNPAEGTPFQYGPSAMFEGYDYVMKDGAPSMNKDDMPDKTIYNVSEYMLVTHISNPKQFDIYKKLLAGEAPSTPAEQVAAKDPEQVKLASSILLDPSAHVYRMVRTAPTPTMTDKGSTLDNYINEQFLKIVYGKEPAAAWDQAIEKWKSSGGAAVETEVRDWYAKATGK